MLISQQEPEITCTTYPFSFSLIKGACYKPEWPGLTGHFEPQGCALSKIEGSLNLDNQRCPAFYLYEKCKIFWLLRAKVRCQGPLGSARVQPCTFRFVQLHKYSPYSRCLPPSCLLSVFAMFFAIITPSCSCSFHS